MRKPILKMSISIDGFVGSPEGEVGWNFRAINDPAAIAWTVETIRQAGVHIMGSKTFRDMVAYWPSSTGPFAEPMNTIPKVVFSRTGFAPKATEAIVTWTDARVASGPLADEVARLKREPGGPIIAHGGARFAQSLAQEGLVDEYRLLVHPVALGRGLPLFSTLTAPLALELVDVQRFERGAVAHVYAKRG